MASLPIAAAVALATTAALGKSAPIRTTSTSWETFCNGNTTGKEYKKRIDDFLLFRTKRNADESLECTLYHYFLLKHELTDNDGIQLHAPTSMRSWLSMFKRWWQFTQGENLDCALVEVMLKQWDKRHLVSKASTFTREDLHSLYSMPHDQNAELLFDKAFAIVAISFAARGCEATFLSFDDVSRVIDANSTASYVIRHERAKQSGPRINEDISCLVTGPDEVAIIDSYIAAFAVENRTGRFWRYLKRNKAGVIYGTAAPIGKNPLSMIGKKIAARLKKANAETYTGHCWRRTAITLGAEAGLSLLQLKSLSGHKSDRIVQQYIDQSQRMKRIHADALAVDQVEAFQPANKRNSSSEMDVAAAAVVPSSPVVIEHGADAPTTPAITLATTEPTASSTRLLNTTPVAGRGLSFSFSLQL